MKAHKIIMLVCWTLIAATLQAQSSSTVNVGTKIDGSELTATCYNLSQRAETFSVDNSGNYLCISFRDTTKNGKYLENKGEIGFYDLKSMKLLWKQPIYYSLTSVYNLSEGVLLKKGNNVSFLKKENGEKVWEAQIDPMSINDSLGLLLGYKSKLYKQFIAVDLKSGTIKWSQKIPHKYGWNQVLNIGNNKRLIVADAIHQLNLKTGEMLTYPGEPGSIDMKSILRYGNILNTYDPFSEIPHSDATLDYIYVPAAENRITGLNSNILSLDSCYYWADRKQISCIDTTLNTIWQTRFPKKITASHSRLFIQNGKLYFLNYGFGFYHTRKNRLKKYGHPFIACYDLRNGKQLFFNQLSAKKDIVKYALRTEEALYMLFDNGLAYQELQNSVVNIVPWNIKEHGKLQGMLPDTLYLSDPEEKTFTPLAFDGEYCLVYNDQGKIYEINKDLAINNEYPLDLIYSPCIHLKDYLCINNRNDYWFIHKLGMPVAHLDFDFRRGKVVDNKLLLLTGDNKLIFLDLDKAVQ